MYSLLLRLMKRKKSHDTTGISVVIGNGGNTILIQKCFVYSNTFVSGYWY